MFGPWTPEAFVRATPWSASASRGGGRSRRIRTRTALGSRRRPTALVDIEPTAIRAVSSSSRSSAGVRASATDRSESRSRIAAASSAPPEPWIVCRNTTISGSLMARETRRDIYKGCPSGDRCRIRPSGVCLLLQRRVERLLEVGLHVVHVLDPHRHSNEAVREPGCEPLLAGIAAWVIAAGCSIRLSTPPSATREGEHFRL